MGQAGRQAGTCFSSSTPARARKTRRHTHNTSMMMTIVASSFGVSSTCTVCVQPRLTHTSTAELASPPKKYKHHAAFPPSRLRLPVGGGRPGCCPCLFCADTPPAPRNHRQPPPRQQQRRLYDGGLVRYVSDPFSPTPFLFHPFISLSHTSHPPPLVDWIRRRDQAQAADGAGGKGGGGAAEAGAVPHRAGQG